MDISSSDGYIVDQNKYTRLDKTSNLSDKKLVDMPLEIKVKYSKDEAEILPDPTGYRQLVGSLIYLMLIQPDIAYAVQTVSQFVSAPRQLYLTAATILSDT